LLCYRFRKRLHGNVKGRSLSIQRCFFLIFLVFIVTGCGAKNPTIPIHGKTEQGTGQNYVNTGDAHSKLGWTPGLPIPYFISQDIPQSNSNQIQKAIEVWEFAVGKKLFEFKGVDTKKVSDFPDNNLYSPLKNPINSQYFFPQWILKTLKSKDVLATTIWYNDSKNKDIITRASTLYNTEYYILGDSSKEFGQGSREIVDLMSLALHEFGHFLGLNHITNDIYSVMNPLLTIGEGAHTRCLSRGDIMRIRSIYGVGDSSLADKIQKADDFSKNQCK